MKSVPVPPGKPRSSRLYKSQDKKPSRTRVSVSTLHTEFAKRRKIEQSHQLIKETEKELKAETTQQRQQIAAVRKEKLKRKEENERKAEVVQVITNARKLKRLSKKKMRGIVKRN